MQKIVFLLYHGTGHFNPCFKLARILQADYEVMFAGHVFFKNYVEDQGFLFYPLKTVPFGLGFENWVNTIQNKKNVYWQSLKDRWTERLYKEREAELSQLIAAYNPGHLLIDSSQSTDFIVLYPLLKAHRIKTGIIHANLSTVTEPDVPPLSTLALPGNAASLRRAHRQLRWKQCTRSFQQWIKYAGKNDRALIRRQILLNRIPKKYISPKPTLFGPAWDQIDQFVMAPLEFEFPSIHRSSFVHFIGFMVDAGRKEEADATFEKVLESLRKKKATGSHLVYCSFGTVHYDDPDKINAFLKKLLAVIRASNDLLIISGSGGELLEKNTLPENIFVFKRVPNFRILASTDIFITHGGFNSIKESIHAGVPMLVYPADPRTDQNGNSARIVYHGLGLRGDLASDSQKEIAEKIKKLLSDTSYQQNIINLNKADSHYTDRNFRKRIEAMKPLE